MIFNQRLKSPFPLGFDLEEPRRAAACRRLALVTGALVLMSTVAVPVLADVPVLGSRVDRWQLGDRDQPSLQLVQSQRNKRAREQAIIGQLEEEIRRLNGRIEELEFEQRQTNNRLDRFIDDLDQRFETLGTGTGTGILGDAGDDQTSGSDNSSQAVRVDGISPEQALQDLAAPSGDGTLGSIPESAVAGLPRPDPKDVAAPERGPVTPEQQYENAVQLLQAGNYQGAQAGLELFLDINEGHQLSSNAAYWLAETHYVRQNYAAAAAAFARNYRTYGKDATKAIDNLLKLGMALSNLGESEKACLSYDELTNAFPNTPAHIGQALKRERARAKCG